MPPLGALLLFPTAVLCEEENVIGGGRARKLTSREPSSFSWISGRTIALPRMETFRSEDCAGTESASRCYADELAWLLGRV